MTKRAHKIEWAKQDGSDYQIKRCTVCRQTFAMSPYPDDDKELGDDCPGPAKVEEPRG